MTAPHVTGPRRRPRCSVDNCSYRELDEWCPAFRALVLTWIEQMADLVDPPVDPLACRVAGPCWMNVGMESTQGYRLKMIGAHRRRLHRVTLVASGATLGDLQVDHLCRNRGCVNPAHLEPVTPRENILRGTSPVAVNAVKTHCKHGHEYTPENTYIYPHGGRECRECQRRRTRQSRSLATPQAER